MGYPSNRRHVLNSVCHTPVQRGEPTPQDPWGSQKLAGDKGLQVRKCLGAGGRLLTPYYPVCSPRWYTDSS